MLITDKVDVGIYNLCLWASGLLTLNTRITQTYHPVTGDAGPGQPPLQRENLAL